MKPFRSCPESNCALACLALLLIPSIAAAQPKTPARPPLQAAPGTAARAGAAPSSPGQSEFSITFEGDYRIIRANGLPDHVTGQFPNRDNPNRILPQSYTFRVPLHPKPAAKLTPLGMNPFGVALNGVVFDPGAAEWWHDDPKSGWQYEAMSGARKLGVDLNHAHVQPNGAYHYHGLPTQLLEKLTGGRPKVALLGWAADGFPIYGPWCPARPDDTNSILKRLRSSYRLKPGTRPGGPGGQYDGSFVEDYEYVKGAGDLDECNGRTGVTAEFPGGTYYYVLTGDFPFIPRMFKGTPDKSFLRIGPDRAGPRPANKPPNPPR